MSQLHELPGLFRSAFIVLMNNAFETVEAKISKSLQKTDTAKQPEGKKVVVPQKKPSKILPRPTPQRRARNPVYREAANPESFLEHSWPQTDNDLLRYHLNRPDDNSGGSFEDNLRKIWDGQ